MPQELPWEAKRGRRRAQDNPKTAPRRPRDGPTTAQSRLQETAFCYLVFKTPQKASKIPPGPPKGPPLGRLRRPQDTPKRGPRGPRASQKGPRATQRLSGFSSGVLGFSPERSWVLAQRSQASVLITELGALALRVLVLKAFRSVGLGFISEILGVSSEVLCFSSDSPTVDYCREL